MVTKQEAQQIALIIKPIFKGVLTEYSFVKYPAAPYTAFQASFSGLNPTNNDIESAMVWKWGHWGKPNIPQQHKNLISEIQFYWPYFKASGQHCSSVSTFQWWESTLDRSTSYITVAYITHLIHHLEPLPIIDQHNFRAMHHLIRAVRSQHTFKKKPSNWRDIQELKWFMLAVCTVISVKYPELDKFLMMYGRSHVPR